MPKVSEQKCRNSRNESDETLGIDFYMSCD